jgi:recombination protein RecA
MAAPSSHLTAALATLRSRWGAAAPSPLSPLSTPGVGVGEVVGALATVPLEHSDGGAFPAAPARADADRIFSTGFGELDAILGPGGVPRGMGVSLRGDLSSGRTTLALRLAAEAQAAGSIVAWLDLAASLDPVEAVARGIKPEWFVVLTPADAEEGLAIAGSLLAGRAVDLLVMDLPARMTGGPEARSRGERAAGVRFGDRLGRLAALARRAGITLVVLEPPGREASSAGSGLAAAVGEATGIRLELARRSWIRLGRDVVGQRTEVIVARNRAGPPGRRATLQILYADGGERDACLRRDGLLAERDITERPELTHLAPVIPVPGNRNDATASSPSPTSPPRPHEAAPALRLVAGGAGGPRREAVVGRERPRRGSRGEGARRPARDAARVGAPAGAGGDLPRRGPGG